MGKARVSVENVSQLSNGHLEPQFLEPEEVLEAAAPQPVAADADEAEARSFRYALQRHYRPVRGGVDHGRRRYEITGSLAE